MFNIFKMRYFPGLFNPSLQKSEVYTKHVVENSVIEQKPMFALHERCPNTEFFLVRIFPPSDQKKLRIWTLFTQCWKKGFADSAGTLLRFPFVNLILDFQ